MDCIDCHNRPTHAFELPENAVDQRMSRGVISPELPFIRKKAVELLKADYPDRDTAKSKIDGRGNRPLPHKLPGGLQRQAGTC